MDYRMRKYYLVKLSPFAYEMRMEYLRIVCERIKIHAPYGHFMQGEYDGNADIVPNMGGINFMLSCPIEYADDIEYELRKAERNDDGHSHFVEITKEMCGQ